jgi:hypothetical protein
MHARGLGFHILVSYLSRISGLSREKSVLGTYNLVGEIVGLSGDARIDVMPVREA